MPLVAVVVVALRRRTRSDTISDVKPLFFLVQWRQKRPPMAWGLHPQVISTPLLRAQIRASTNPRSPESPISWIARVSPTLSAAPRVAWTAASASFASGGRRYVPELPR